MGKLNILISSPENASGNCYMKYEVEGWLIPVVASKLSAEVCLLRIVKMFVTLTTTGSTRLGFE